MASNPLWWQHLHQIQHVFALKTETREAWDLIDLENRIKVAPVSATHTRSSKAPKKIFYHKVFQTHLKATLEPAYVSGYAPPTEMLGLVAMDQFRQRHLSPPCHMSKQDVVRYLQWKLVEFPPLDITVSLLR